MFGNPDDERRRQLVITGLEYELTEPGSLRGTKIEGFLNDDELNGIRQLILSVRDNPQALSLLAMTLGLYPEDVKRIVSG